MSASAIISAVLSLFSPPSHDESNNVNNTVNINFANPSEQLNNHPSSKLLPPNIKPKLQFSKISTFLAITGMSYIATYFYLSKLTYKLNNTSCCSKYFQNLHNNKTDKSKQNFMATIKKYYFFDIQKKNKTPLITRLYFDIKTEKDLLKHYLKLARCIKKIKLETVFPIDTKLLQEIPKRLKQIKTINTYIADINNTYILREEGQLVPPSTSSGQRATSAETPK